ncbi:tetratricopeptide repeat-containing sensor histidine kinase [Arthrospiribacter ruber]|uniref:tetratricopeptide repeat-containing sensor histidine kinase n=1 Tax=Arthrospiribacter ruber TaxID=2487934 RepID=UPI001FECD195|nr:ATP-binding protein [Arthrospiribacter ruber]
MLYKEGTEEDIITYFPEGINLALQQHEFDVAGRWSIELYQVYERMPGQRQKALELMQRAVDFSKNVESSVLRGSIFLKLAAAHYNLGDFDTAIEGYSQAIEEFEVQDSIYVADALFFRGQAKDYIGDFINSLTDYQQAALYYELLGDDEFTAHVENSMGILFSKYELYEEAEKIRLSLLDKYQNLGFDREWAVVMLNRASSYKKLGHEEKNRELLLETFDFIEKENLEDPELEISVNLALAIHYATTGNQEKYRFHYDKAENLREEKIGSGSFLDLTFLRAVYLGEKNFSNPQNAIKSLNEYKSLASQLDKFSDQMDALKFEADLMNDLGRHKEAFEALTKLTEKKDSLMAVNKAASFAFYQTLYETEKKERELLNKEVEIKNITASNQRRLAWIIGGFLTVLVLLSILYLYRGLQSAKKARAMQEQFSRDLLVYQEEERKRISKDLHDGLGQSLLLIKNKVAMSADPSAAGLLNSAIEELRGISRSLHPFQLEELGLTKAIQNTLDHLDEETDIFVSSELDDVDHLLSKEEQLHIYRILQEVFNNILKHAEASAVRVLLLLENSNISLSIEDNGIGFDFSEKYQDFGSLGLKTLKERTAGLKGTMKVDSEKGKGTKFSFYFYK